MKDRVGGLALLCGREWVETTDIAASILHLGLDIADFMPAPSPT